MRNKIIVLIVIALFITLFYLYKKNAMNSINPIPNTSIKSEAAKQQKTLKPTENDYIAEIDRSKKKSQDTISTPIHMDPVYDADPFVDKTLIAYNHAFCYQQLSFTNKSKRYLMLEALRLDDKQKEFLKKHKHYCQELNKQHPEFNLTNQIAFNKSRKNMKATSYWGEITSHEIEAESLSDVEISAILKQNNLNILSQAPRYLRHYYQNTLHWELEDVLQNHQYNYTDYILNYAHQLYVCNLGSDCSPTSTIMVALCYSNSLSCGIDYSNYLKTLLTQGQQADILLALGYLQKQYQ